MPKGGKDAFLSKVTFRKESDWFSKTKQILLNMKTIEERAKEYANKKAASAYSPERGFGTGDYEPEEMLSDEEFDAYEEGYIQGATEQKAIDDDERDEAVYNLLMLKLDGEKKLWAEKAKRAFCKAKECIPYDKCHRANGGCFAMQSFIQAMEE